MAQDEQGWFLHLFIFESFIFLAFVYDRPLDTAAGILQFYLLH
jgi:hypothetical protein